MGGSSTTTTVVLVHNCRTFAAQDDRLLSFIVSRSGSQFLLRSFAVALLLDAAMLQSFGS